jgi:prophage tail gpP-like protein
MVVRVIDAPSPPPPPPPAAYNIPTLAQSEKAVLIVGNRRFENFESVWVQLRWTEAYPQFRFSTADIVEVPGQPPPANWQELQFKPGDECAVYLGGYLAVAGVITVRQTAYDKENKGVQLSGIGVTWYAARASVIHATGNFDGKSFEQVAREVLAPTGISPKVIGTLDATPFARLQVDPGETIWSFLERIARPRGIILGSDNEGHFLLIGDHVGQLTSDLVEGVNILRCQAVISVENIFNDYIIRGQSAASDDMNGPQASEQEAAAGGTALRYSPLLTMAEQPVWSVGELATRAQHEAVWHEGTIVQATITVQGWIRPGTNLLWMTGDDVMVRSPMAMLNQVLKIETVTFTQDRNSGTLTSLDLVAPWLLKDHSDFNLGVPGAPQAPDKGTPTTTPAATPPATPSSDPPPLYQE